MLLGRIVGNVVATVKDPQLVGEKILLVQFINRKREPIGRPQAAIDVVGAGQDEFVFCVRARDAVFATYPVSGPIDLAIVGIVESIDAVENIDLELPFGESFYT